MVKASSPDKYGKLGRHISCPISHLLMILISSPYDQSRVKPSSARNPVVQEADLYSKSDKEEYNNSHIINPIGNSNDDYGPDLL